ncbi:hypothetical protein [Sulfurimonas sp.]|uniref:hypothetical protein n=1 Tax=Sulfurimonas sp. TaxID=2022749 RepID=UPI0025CE37C9|nr:hypothetical protein [Sulfurimonas sp.]
MKKIFLISLSLCVALLAADTPTKTGIFPEKEMKLQKKEIASLVAKEIASTLPQVIDKYTTLASITNKDTTLIYTFEINTGVKSDETIQKEDRTRMKEAVTTGICQSSSKFLQAGINTSYVYVSAKTKVRLFQFDIAQKDCPVVLN